ncbi:MAG: hypothetical protein Q7W16_02395 [Coriobacteriia bacterium]|nr:hypothetical protein [Coriobacteriia bacterium]
MHAGRLTILAVVACALALTGCKGGALGAGGAAPREVPAAFKADAAKGADLAIGAKGGGIAVRSGDATAAVYVPAGAAKTGATWRVTPLTEAPSGARKPLCPGVYVDTTGGEPTQPCAIGFALPGTATVDATIVRISDDGTASEIVPTTRLVYGGMTMLTAYVDGFSTYTTSEEDAAARDKAFTDKAAAKGQVVDWTIKAGGKETQTNQGWTFNYELDLFASGGGIQQGGFYDGRASLFMDGEYKGPASSIVSSFGKVKSSGRDEKLRFIIIEAPLADLLTGASVGDPIVAGAGTMNLEGLASLDIQASAPNVKGQYNSGDVSGSGGAPFLIRVTTNEDVQIEIPNIGIFPGKILRTTK